MIDAALADQLYADALETARDPASPPLKLPRLRTLLETLYRALSAESGEYLPELFPCMEWVDANHPAPPEVQRAAHALRMLVNDTLHKGLKPGEAHWLGALQGLCRAVGFYSGEAVPAELEAVWAGKEAVTYSRQPDPQPMEVVPFVRALVLKEGRERRHRRPDGGEVDVSDLFCDLGDLGKAPVTFWDLFAPLGQLARKGSTLHLFDLRRRTQEGGRIFFSTIPDRTLAVLEPDLLVDAGDLNRFCHKGKFQAALWFACRCLRDDRSEPVLRGNLVNGMLDRLLATAGGHGRFEEHWAVLAQEHAAQICLLDAAERSALEAGVRAQFTVLRKLLPTLELDHPAVEPAFLSDRFGLQGRLDVMAGGAEEWRRDIYELKSGKPPSSGAWPNDRAQTTAYDLLLDSVSGERRRGLTAVIYPRDEDHPLRRADSTIGERQRLLMNRNRLAALERDLGDPGFDPEALLAVPEPGLPAFQQQRVDRFASAWAEGDETARAYFRLFLRFTARERRQAWVGGEVHARPGFAALWQRSLEEKLRAFSVLPWLEPRPGGGGQVQTLVLARGERTPAVSCFRPGDAALLYAMDGERCEPTRRQVTKCTVSALAAGTVTVRLRNPQLGAAHFRAHRHWALEPDLLDHGFAAMSRSLFELLAAPPERRGLLLGLRRPRFAGDPRPEPETPLDSRQLDILTRALRAQDYFLVQGPPGTGKTRLVLHELVRYLFTRTNESVLLAAFTNQAADEICGAVAPVCPGFIRIGRPEAVSPLYQERLLGAVSARAAKEGPDQLRAALSGTRLWVSTVASLSAHDEVFQLKSFDTLVVDEASQLLEPQLVGLLCRARRFILIGDEKQLPAVVQQPEALTRVTEEPLRRIGLRDLRLSLFERLLDRAREQGWDDAQAMLVRQARMHRDLAALPSRLFYGNRLELMDPRRQQAPIARFDAAAADPLARALARSRLVYVPSRRDPLAQQNEHEAQIVKRVLETVRAAWGVEFADGTAGVITPFRRQIAAILAALPRDLARQVTVDTVERFQGGEREAIVLSMAMRHPAQVRLVRSLTADGAVDRKLNVALTRARGHFVLTGVEEVLRADRFYRELLQSCLRVELPAAT